MTALINPQIALTSLNAYLCSYGLLLCMMTMFSLTVIGSWVKNGCGVMGKNFRFNLTAVWRCVIPCSFLADESVLNSVNKWRRIRGEPEITMLEINPDAAGSIGTPSWPGRFRVLLVIILFRPSSLHVCCLPLYCIFIQTWGSSQLKP